MTEVTEEQIKIEKEKARQLRKSRWWQNKIANNPICYYCGASLSKGDVTMDHVVPLAKGGKSTKGNVVIACKSCNNKKKYLTLVEWEEYLASR